MISAALKEVRMNIDCNSIPRRNFEIGLSVAALAGLIIMDGILFQDTLYSIINTTGKASIMTILFQIKLPFYIQFVFGLWVAMSISVKMFIFTDKPVPCEIGVMALVLGASSLALIIGYETVTLNESWLVNTVITWICMLIWMLIDLWEVLGQQLSIIPKKHVI